MWKIQRFGQFQVSFLGLSTHLPSLFNSKNNWCGKEFTWDATFIQFQYREGKCITEPEILHTLLTQKRNLIGEDKHWPTATADCMFNLGQFGSLVVNGDTEGLKGEPTLLTSSEVGAARVLIKRSSFNSQTPTQLSMQWSSSMITSFYSGGGWDRETG